PHADIELVGASLELLSSLDAVVFIRLQTQRDPNVCWVYGTRWCDLSRQSHSASLTAFCHVATPAGDRCSPSSNMSVSATGHGTTRTPSAAISLSSLPPRIPIATTLTPLSSLRMAA